MVEVSWACRCGAEDRLKARVDAMGDAQRKRREADAGNRVEMVISETSSTGEV